MKLKVVAYPIYAETASIIRYRDLIHDYEIIGCSAPKGYCLLGRDSSYADEGIDSGLIVQDIEELFAVSDGLLLLPFLNNCSMEQHVRKCVEQFWQRQKK